MEWEAVIGLEVHAQLNTNTKIFSGASTAYGALPNTQACAVDLGFPGVLPVLNKDAVSKAVMLGLALNANVAKRSVFARKNYFYPDLPKGYQISQYELPIVETGYLDVLMDDGETKRIGITRAHLEEDAGKSLHEDFHGMSGIDLNRAGTPLIEIVSEPDLRSAKEAVSYLKMLHAMVCYLDICDGNMQEGSFRCDANVSVRPKGDSKLGTRAELKNINSFRFVERAINFEIERQIALIESGGTVRQETRLYDANKNETRSMRGKEEANDYRYFPDPDLLPVEISDDDIKRIKENLPELPEARKKRLQDAYGLTEYDAAVLTAQKTLADYYERTLAIFDGAPKVTANWVMGELSAALNKHNLEITETPVEEQALADLVARINDGTISGKIAKSIFESLWAQEGSVDEIIRDKGLEQVSDDSAIEALVEQVIEDNPQQFEQYRSGKDKLFGFFVGQVMKLSKGKANPQKVNNLLKKKLDG